MFKSLLVKVGFIRRWMKRNIKKALEELMEKVDHQGAFNPEDITALHNIVKSPVVTFKEELVLGVRDDIGFYTNTSVRALSALEKMDDSTLNFGRNPDIKIAKESRPFNKWYSNKESVTLFVSTLSSVIEQQHLLYSQTPGIDGVLGNPITEQEEMLFDSLCYRLLKFDLMEILYFYMVRDVEL